MSPLTPYNGTRQGKVIGMFGRLFVWQVIAVVTAIFLLTTPGAAEPPRLSIAEADDACASYAAAYISHTEADYKDHLAEWKFKCEHHPVRLRCEDTNDTVQTMISVSPFKCGQPVIVIESPSPPADRRGAAGTAELPPVDPEVAHADNACADYAAAYISHTEADFKDKLPGWKFKCEHHPLKLRCEDTNDSLRTMRSMSPLKCVGGAASR